MFETNELKKLSIDLYKGKVENFSTIGKDPIAKMVAEIVGEKPTMYTWNKNKLEVFQIIGVALEAVVPEILRTQFDAIAEVRNVGMGDKPEFFVEDSSILSAGHIAAGTQDLRRQEIINGKFTVDTGWIGTKVYAELDRFLSGEINWQQFVDRQALALVNHIQTRIYDAVSGAYDSLRPVRKQEGRFDADKLLQIAQHVQAASGANGIQVWGTKRALRNISKDLISGGLASNEMKATMNTQGFIGTFAGLNLIEMPQAYKANTEEFAIKDNQLIILPAGQDRLVKVVFEGQIDVTENTSSNRNDLQMELVTRQKVGVHANQYAVMGLYNIEG
jgi:hypothetical protein